MPKLIGNRVADRQSVDAWNAAVVRNAFPKWLEKGLAMMQHKLSGQSMLRRKEKGA
ncbi:hypothetical protein E4U42_002547 [Claviceps africana]|uniref:Uncharacterized protein n=1 Tax=Claviceps africana TaxID=83212 RepID=A0A8K0J8L2_9HYPO|nr:hypothetical protein E4U42_002547 [Claviceps africana]